MPDLKIIETTSGMLTAAGRATLFRIYTIGNNLKNDKKHYKQTFFDKHNFVCSCSNCRQILD